MKSAFEAPNALSHRIIRAARTIVPVLALCVATTAFAQGTIESVALTLSRHHGYPDGVCRLAVTATKNGGQASLLCGISPNVLGAASGPFAEDAPPRQRSRALTPEESLELRRLYDASRLFTGGHEGKDLTAVDGVFEILIVRGVRAVVLVTSGNPTFESGPRKDLLAWLRGQEAILRKAIQER
jgi:hypothetical protein